MGILNVTPDSFSEQGKYFDRRAAVARGLEIEREGADLLDIGGESTRPGASPVDEQEELDRTIPVIEALRKKGVGIPISIDTYKSAVAERALRAGAEIVNDISGLRYDDELAAVAARHRAAVILMHMRGTPTTMQKLPRLKRLMPSILDGLAVSMKRALDSGVSKHHIVLDPGIGFGKGAQQNFEILRKLPMLSRLGCPILVGTSRKSFLQHLLNEPPFLSGQPPKTAANRKPPSGASPLLLGTAASIVAAILNGAHIVRVHDVREMLAVIRVADQLLDCPSVR